jgi:HAD superfamily hydrolase (TIGR01509 family)
MASADGAVAGVLFDLDGVLAESEPVHAQAWIDILGAVGDSYRICDFDRWIGVSDSAVGVCLAKRHGGDAVQLVTAKRERFRALVPELLRADPDLHAMLARLSVPAAVCTGSSRADATVILEAVGLSDHFAVVVTSDDVTLSKPDPSGYRQAAAGIGVPPERCVAIEDSPTGAAAAAAAGCRVLGVTTTHAAAQLQACAGIHADTVAALASLAV